MFSISSRPYQDWATALNRLSLLEVACWLHSIGGNVFPLIRGTKNGFPYPWGRLTYTRLPCEALHHIFAGSCNLAIMMGATSQNLFVLDCETPSAFQSCIRELECRNIAICAVETARGGHIYLRTAGVVQNIASGILPDMEVRGTGGYVLLPPSLHPSGCLYHFVRWEQPAPPVVDIRQLDFLTNSAGQPVSLQIRPLRQRGDRRLMDLTRKTRDYLESGANLPEGVRNVRLFSAATDMLGCGYGVANTGSRLLAIATQSGLSSTEVQRTLDNASRRPCVAHKVIRASQSSFNEGLQTATSAQTSSAPQAKALWAFAMHALVTPGRKGDSERRLLLAMVALYQRGTKTGGVFRGSQREWLELAHLSDHHASEKALLRLQQPGLEHPPILRVCGADKLSGARLWQIAEWVFEAGQQLLRETSSRVASVGEDNRLGVDTLNNADYLERGALGINGYRIYEVLCQAEKQLSLKQIAEDTQLSVDTVRYHLREERPLRQHGLVQIHGGKRNRTYDAAAVSHDELNIGIAAACGTAGKSIARQKKHQQEQRWFMAGFIIRRMEPIWTSAATTHCSPRSTSVVGLPATPQVAVRSNWRTSPVRDQN